jgi:hypothetical protein
MISFSAQMSRISQILDIPSLKSTSISASLKGGAILFLTTLTFTLFPVVSLSSHDPDSIFSFLLISSLCEA